MKNENGSIHDAEYWKRMPLVAVEEVLKTLPRQREPYKSEFRSFFIDLSGAVPVSFARTLSGQRVELSVLECDSNMLDELAGYLDWAREGLKGVPCQIGYTRDFSHGKPRLKYIQTVNGREVRAIVF